MSNYTKTTNFAAKDSLPSGNAGKIVKGTEIDAEFNNIATASATKANINDATLTGTTVFGSLNDGTITITGWVDEDNMSSNSAVLIPTQQSVKAYVDSNVTAQDLDVTDGSASIDIDLDSESLGILGGTGVTSTASGTGVTLAIDSTVATLTGSQTLTNKTLTTPTILTSFTIGSATITEAELEILDGATVTTAELNVLDGITSTTAELNILDGVTSTAAELNILDGVTSTTAELNKLDGFTGTVADLNYAKDLNATGVTASEFDILDGLTATTAELNILDGVTSTAAELNILDGVTSTTAELNILDGVTSTAAELNILDGVTSTTAELNILDGVTSTATELNLLDGVTSTTAELNYTDGVTSAIQTQLDSKISGADAALTGNATITTSDNTTQLALISTDADANAGPILDLFRNSVSAADNDLAAQVYFSGNNDADEKTYYGQITSQITDVSNGSEDFALELSTLTAGASNSRLFISPTETVFNESSADLDFRVESDGNANMLFVDAANNRVGLGTNGPGSLLDLGVGTSGANQISWHNDATTSYGNIWQMLSNAATVIGHGLKGSATVAGGFQASTSSTWGRSAIEQYYGDIKFYANAASATTYGAAYTPTERLRITSAGNVGVGTSAPKGKINIVLSQADTSSSSDTTLANSFLHLGGGEYGSGRYYLTTYGYANGRTNPGAYVGALGTSNTGFGAYDLVFGTRSATTDSAPLERMRIDSAGNLGIGTNSPSSYFSGATNLVLSGTGDSGLTINSGTSNVGRIHFADGTSGADQYKGYIVYQHAEDSMQFATGGVEGMRIDSTGKVIIGATATIGSTFGVTGNASAGPLANLNSTTAGDLNNSALYIRKQDSNTTASQAFIAFVTANSGSGEIVANGASQAAFGSWSDRRLKENIEDLPSQLSNITSLRPVEFDYKDGSGHQIGFIAQELQEIYPDAVSENSDTGMLKVAGWTKNEAIFVKAIQEQQATIEALTQRIETLENN